MSWLSKTARKAIKPVAKALDKGYGALGMGTGNTLRRALDPMSIQLHKIARGDTLNARLIADPGNELMAAPTKQGVNAPQINPLTGQPGTNARDMIAAQMSGASPPTSTARPVVNPGFGNAGSPTYGIGMPSNAGTLAQIPSGPSAPPSPAAPLPNYGDIHAIQAYVQGRAGAPQTGGVDTLGAPQKRPMFGPGVRYT